MFKRKKDINDLINELLKLYNYYESYCWNHPEENPRINIYNGDLTYKIEFLINNIKEDSFELNFDGSEIKLYEYVSLKMLVSIFKNVKIYMDDNNIYNKTHKGYLSLKYDDGSISQELRAIVVLLNSNHLDDVNNVLNTKYTKLKRSKKIDEGIVIATQDRLLISKKLIRNGKNQ